jgi:hypothetical protein
LEYQIPQLAKAHFGRLVQELRETRRVRRATVLDVGCSYGINAALLRCDATMNDLYDRYCGYDASVERATLLARDRQWTRVPHPPGTGCACSGLDVSSEALAYAVASGLLDDAVNADLENGELTDHQRACWSRWTWSSRPAASATSASARSPGSPPCPSADRGWPTRSCGCTGSSRWRSAWRGWAMTPYGWMDQLRQRRFASAEEQANVLDTLSDLGVDPGGLETDGWLYAELFVSRPAAIRVVSPNGKRMTRER